MTLRVRSAEHLKSIYTISRRFGEPPEVISGDTGDVTPLRPIDILPRIEIYSQSEILRIADDSKAQSSLLDRFLPDQSDYKAKMSELKKRLAENREELVKIGTEKDRLESEFNQLPALKEKIAVFKKIGIEEKLKRLQILGKEKGIVGEVDEQIQRIVKWVDDYSDLFALDFIDVNAIKNLPNEAILKSMSDTLEKLQTTCRDSITQIQKHIELCRKEIEKNKDS